MPLEVCAIVKNLFRQQELYPFKKENSLLIDVLKDNLSEKDLLKTKRELQEPLQWDYLLERSFNHRVTPIVYNTLRKYGILSYIPNTVQMEMRKVYLGTLATNLGYLEEVKIISEKCKTANLNLMVLKGAAFAQSLYGDSGLRPFADIDILVNRKDMDSIQQIMKKLGYKVYEDHRPLDFYDKYHFHHIYIKKNDFISSVIEIHWDLFSPSSPIHFDLDSLWKNGIIIDSTEMKINTLNWDDHFLYLCAVHCYQDVFNSLLHFCDLTRIAQNKLNQKDWNVIENKAKRWGIERVVACCVQIINDLFGESISYPTRLYITHDQKTFIQSIFSHKNLIQQYSNTERGIRPLMGLFFLNQKKRDIIKSYLFPGDMELYRWNFTILKKITVLRKFFFFLIGVRRLTLLGLSLLKIRFFY